MLGQQRQQIGSRKPANENSAGVLSLNRFFWSVSDNCNGDSGAGDACIADSKEIDEGILTNSATTEFNDAVSQYTDSSA